MAQSLGTGWAGFWGPNALLTSNGTPLANTTPTITILTSAYPTPTGSGTPTFYSDWTRGTTVSPPTTDGLGNLSFWTDPGSYLLSYTVTGYPTSSFIIVVNPYYPDAAWNVPATGDSSSQTPPSGDHRFANAGSGTLTETLPAPSSLTRGSRFRVTKTDSSANAVVVVASGGSSILQPTLGGGWSAQPEISIFGQNTSMEFISDSSNWYMVGNTSRRVGVVEMFAGATPPSGAFLCYGQAISRTVYADLFAVIGTTYGVGDGSSTFNIPDFRSVSPIGGGTGSLHSGAGGTTNRSIGTFYGNETHTIAANELPAHNHNIGNNSGATRFFVQPVTGTQWMPFATTPAGFPSPFTGNAFLISYGSATDNAYGFTTATPIVGPSLAINFIIWAQ